VVKALNTVTASLMVNAALVANGDHTLFICGNDAEAKAQVTAWLREWFGWQDVLDLGDITSSRGMEMYLPLWLRLWGALGTGMLNVKVVK
jgi:predicted dinucleotide-binding enzyme